MLVGSNTKVACISLKSATDSDSVQQWMASHQGVTIQMVAPMMTSIMIFYEEAA